MTADDKSTAKVTVTVLDLAEVLNYVWGKDSIAVVQHETVDRLFAALKVAIKGEPAEVDTTEYAVVEQRVRWKIIEWIRTLTAEGDAGHDAWAAWMARHPGMNSSSPVSVLNYIAEDIAQLPPGSPSVNSLIELAQKTVNDAPKRINELERDQRRVRDGVTRLAARLVHIAIDDEPTEDAVKAVVRELGDLVSPPAQGLHANEAPDVSENPERA